MVKRSWRVALLRPGAARASLLLGGSLVASSCALVIGVDGNYIEGVIGGGGALPTTTTTLGGGGTTTTTLLGGGGTTTTTLLGGGGAGGNVPLPLGAPCSLGTDCQSGQCVDGVCCNGACAALCESCIGADTGGTNGTCAPVSAGLDPADECDGPASCDGSRACSEIGVPCPNGTECTSHACVDGFCCATACDQACEACDAASTGESDGACAPLTPGLTDPNHCQPTEVCGPDGCLDCGLEPAPPGPVCPGVCTGGCTNNVCRIACTANNACRDDNIVCPPDLACEVVCAGSNACTNTTIDCPSEYACDVQCACSGPSHSCCLGTTVQCADGTCDMTCSAAADACTGATLECGERDCAATCDGASEPTVHCSAWGCDCTSC